MNISKENIDELNAILTIEFEKADYEPKVEKAIKDYGKKVSLKGFRPGHAPVAMVKKFYGKSILAEQIDDLVSTTLSTYINENKLNVLGNPLPNKEQQPIDFDGALDTISFKFDLGLAPDTRVDIKALSIPSYSIEISDADVEEQIKNITSRYGSHVAVETSSADSLVKGVVSVGDFKNEKGLLSVTVIKDEEQKALFIGKKAGDTVEFDLHKTCADAKEIQYLLEISEEEVAGIAADAKATIVISEVQDFKPAAIDSELFTRLYPDGSVTDEESFRANVKKQIESGNKLAEESRFDVDARQAMMSAAGDIKLPEEFLKRWLTVINKDNEKFSQEVLEQEFPKFVEDTKWQIVKGDLVKANDIKIEYQDVLEHAKLTTRIQFMQYGINNIPEAQLEEYARGMLQKEEQRQRLAEGAVEQKLFDFVKQNANVEQKAISRDEFGKLYANK